MPVDMNKTIADASLNNLHDIVVPDAVGFFPLAPGWYMVFLLFLTLVFHFALKRYRLYQKEQYRRDAVDELAGLQQVNKENAKSLLSLAKRVGISAYGREHIAKLNEDCWWDFMQNHSKATIHPALRSEIHTLLYKEDAVLSDGAFDAIVKIVTQWIKTHKVAEDV